MVFQHFNLFPHLTILENCTLAPIWVRRMPKREAEEIAMRYLTRVQHPGAGEEISRPALRRPAAARGDRARALHEPAHHALRRADLGARSGDDQGSARRHGRSRRGGHDHARRHPRDGLRPPGRRTASSSWMPARSSSRTSRRQFFNQSAARADQAVPQPDPALRRPSAQLALRGPTLPAGEPVVTSDPWEKT